MADVDTAGDTGRPDRKAPVGGRDPVPAVVDWLLGAVTAAVGLSLIAVGVGLYIQVDRATITEVLTADSTEVNGLTIAEAVAAGVPFVDWLSVGIAATGLGLVVAAVAFVRARRQTRQQVASEGGTTATFWASAVYGATVTTLVSFIPGSGVVGGALASYLRESGSGARVGAASGLVVWALTVPLLVSLVVATMAGASAVDMLGSGTVLSAVAIVGELVALALNLGLGALGGYLTDRFL